MGLSADFPSSEDATILQLHKWRSSEVELLRNLLEFREGFISPSRELLLLHSYHCEGLLLPLDKESSNSMDPENSQSHALLHPDSAAGTDSFLRTSESIEMDSSHDFTLRTSFVGSDDCSFISDVHSLAWGLCGEVCNQREDASFRELLFVLGRHGVTVHAFCKSYRGSENMRPIEEGNTGKGTWMEWGPSLNDSHSLGVQEDSSSCCEVAQISCATGINSRWEKPHPPMEASLNELSVPRRWLRTFFSQVETIKSDGHLFTTLPKRPSFPSSAKVVSFNIFSHDSQLLGLLFENSVLYETESPDLSSLGVGDNRFTALDVSSSAPVSNEHVLSNSVTGGINSSCKCFQIFSNDSHCLIGFALELMHPTYRDSKNLPKTGRSKIVVAVARLVSWAMQWVSLVVLDESPDSVEWTDFKLSHAHLICLNTSGLISFYSAMTGECIASLDLLHDGGFCHCLNPSKSEKSSVKYNGHIFEETRRDLSCEPTAECTGKRRFKSLVIVSFSPLIGAIDEFGAVYVMNVDDHILGKPEPAKPYLREFPHGILSCWEVGGTDIGCQRGLSGASGIQNTLPRIHRGFLSTVDAQSKDMQSIQEHDHEDQRGLFQFFVSGFSSVDQTTNQQKFLGSESPSHFMRKIFLPMDRTNGDEVICLSPFGITRLVRKYSYQKTWKYKLVHSSLLVDFTVKDDHGYEMGGWEASMKEAIGCTFKGCLYLVTEDGLSVVLPAISGASSFLPVEAIGYRQLSSTAGIKYETDIWGVEITGKPWSPWKLEVLDRVLLYEGADLADQLCLENGWGLRISRIRWLQLALDYLKFDEIESSLEMLACIHLAEEGILRLIFAAVYLMFQKVSNDNEVSAASRLLALATGFAINTIRKYGLLHHKKDNLDAQGIGDFQAVNSLQEGVSNHLEHTKRMSDMAHYLEIIRNLQLRLSVKFKRPGHRLLDGADALMSSDAEATEDDDSKPLVLSADVSLSDTGGCHDALLPSEMELRNAEIQALVPVETSNGEAASTHSAIGNKSFPVENPKDMMTRWELDNLDLKNIVKDALTSGRLPLAVLKLHLLRSREFAEEETHDTFNEVRDVGRAIAYDLFLKGETALAIATLQKLGEDVETSLRQLLFGTLRRSLRLQIAEEMKIYGYLRPRERKILEMISLIERIYPCSSFQNTFCTRLNELKQESDVTAFEKIELQLLHSKYRDLRIVCGEVDGIVLGLWTNINGHSVSPELDDDSSHAGYWTAAAVWSDAWDQITIDRVVLDQPFLMGVNVLWESQLEYHMGHNDWEEISKLLDVIPSYAVSSGSLSIRSESLHLGSALDYGQENSVLDNYMCSIEDLDAVCFTVPNIRISRFSTTNICSLWLRTLMEDQLAKKFIFLKEYWESTTDIVTILARSGYMLKENGISILDESPESSSDFILSITDVTVHPDAVLALHKIIIHFCAQFNLPHVLDLYLDYHKLAVDQDSLSLVQDAVGDNEWAKWLLLLRVKGKEYEASFCNARAVASPNLILGNNLSVLEIGDIIRTVDDIAEGAGEMVALATLMYAPIPIEECLSSGSINRQCSSAQCTLENLKPALQRFPTLWRTLIAACFGQDPTCDIFTSKPKVSGYSGLLDYLSWRENVFFSSGHDTSLLQMLPCWFPKTVRRLIQFYVQGPLGWQSVADLSEGEFFLSRNFGYLANSDDHSGITALSWEAAIQKHIEKELHSSSAEETGFGVEHHLHRGRALAAFSHLLVSRVEKLKMANTQRGKGTSAPGQTNVQSDLHALLSPITPSEESLLSVVVPLAIVHFEDSVLVASCALLLELCGLPASILQIDISALRRISSFYRSGDYADFKNHSIQLSPQGSALHGTFPHGGDLTESLAQALADDYLHNDYPSSIKRKGLKNDDGGKPPSRALVMFLQHLEKASLPSYADEMTCGSWLSTGNGDGAELRSQQKSASQYWNLVTIFCQMHQIPLSTKYLALLAKDNDWVGFLSEAQVGGFPFETVIEVASKDFNNPRLKIHILTVLKSMHLKKKVTSGSNSESTGQMHNSSITEENIYGSVELFGIIAECEKLKNPGEALLVKAKDLCWSILAMIASCFPDVSPLSCLAVWLEITAARETSAIKVNDIASQIANNIGAAVEATNSLPASARALTFHYNRKNPKRRRLLEPILANSSASPRSNASATSGSLKFEGVISDEEREEPADGGGKFSCNSEEMAKSLSRMVAVLCEQRLFSPLLRAFEIFLPSCSLLPCIRALQAFSQMRLPEASAHLGSFSARIKEETEGPSANLWISTTAVKAADAMLSTCPSPYEKRCLLQLLAAADFGDGGSAAMNYRRLYWKINLAEPSLRKDHCLHLGNEPLDDASLLTALVKNACWEQARNWAGQLEASGGVWKSAVHHVTEMQAESMVAEWKEFLWDVPEERVALWAHCQTLFIRYAFPASQAGLFFLKHAEAAEKDLPARELHELLLLSLQWLSGMISQTNPVCPLNLLREIETRVWLLAVESESQMKREGEILSNNFIREPGSGKGSNIIDLTAKIIGNMDNHILSLKSRTVERSDLRENNQTHIKTPQIVESPFSATIGGGTKTKRRAKGFLPSRRPLPEEIDKSNEPDCVSSPPSSRDELQVSEENIKFESLFSRWEERVGPEELERAILSLLEFGQVTAARQLQQKLSPDRIPSELVVSDTALKLAAISTPNTKVTVSVLDGEVRSVLELYNLLIDHCVIEPLQVLESLAANLAEGRGSGLCKRIISIVKAANILGLSFSEAFDKQPIELLQLLTLKAQDSFEEANLLVQTHSMPPASIAQVLAESFLKGLLAAHRGGYMDSQKEEGPAPLLWRFSDFLKWAELCPSEPEIGHALMRLVITGQEIPHACEVELLILSHHFYKSSICLDGVDVLVALAATRVEAYVSEGDFSCLARLITGVGNFHALNFILGILIENGQLDLLLQKFSAAADANTDTAEAVRGFRMAVLTSLQQFNSSDLDAFAMVYNHFDMKHETATLLETRGRHSSEQWFFRYDKDQTEDLLESMRYYIDAAEVYSSIDAGNSTRKACAQASLMSIQIRMPDLQWLNLSETNARRVLVEQSCFQEALIVAEAYNLNQPSEWALVLWNQMLKPELTEQFVAEFVAVLPLQPSMLVELARFYRAEVAARGDQSHFSVWLTGGGLPAEWAKYLGRSFRCLLRRTRDLRLRLQLATLATGFSDVIDACNKALDKVPENAGPLVLRKGHGGAYLPLM